MKQQEKISPICLANAMAPDDTCNIPSRDSVSRLESDFYTAQLSHAEILFLTPAQSFS